MWTTGSSGAGRFMKPALKDHWNTRCALAPLASRNDRTDIHTPSPTGLGLHEVTGSLTTNPTGSITDNAGGL